MFSKFSKKIEPLLFNISEQLLYYAACDYLKFSFIMRENLEHFLDAIKKEFPGYGKIIDVNEGREKYKNKKTRHLVDEDLKQLIKLKFPFADTETKYICEKYDLIIHRHDTKYTCQETKEEKVVSTYYCDVSGELAKKVFNKIFLTNWLRLKSTNELIFSLTRIDFRFDVPGFDFTFFYRELDNFLAFNQLQNLRNFRFDRDLNFAIGYINNRSYRNMLRFYLSIREFKKRFEIELKNTSVKAYMACLQEKNLSERIYKFNKLLILEIIHLFETIHHCDYTAPLKNWVENDLKVLRDHFFAGEKFLSRNSNNNQLNHFTETKALHSILSKNHNLLNSVLVKQEELSDNKQGKKQLILSYCTILLLKKWYTVDQHQFFDIKARLHPENWEHSSMEKEFLINSDLYKINFHFLELLKYLHLPENSISKKTTLELIKEIIDTKVSYQVKNAFYYQPFFYNFTFEKGINQPSSLHLSLNPYITYGLLSSQHAVLIDERLREKYYKLVDKHTLNNKKKSFSFIHAVYVTFCFSFGFNKPELLNAVL